MKSAVLAPLVLTLTALAQPLPDIGRLKMESVPGSRFIFTGLVGERIDANKDNWLLRAPQANPGMIEMFTLRDRKPAPQLVPWAGEFVGKYLISAVLALRMTDDPLLRHQVSNVVAAFVATQAEDGYLGPFPKEVRLLKNWDLWGHYHAISGLILWYQETRDPSALAGARKAADLVCRTYLNTGRRVFDAGDAEMNMSILTGMALLHRVTGEPRYLQMVREVEKDWERAGDYLRAGLDGREYFQSPRPRWESLHDLQGLMELWRITGDAKYRDAFIHHWRSIRRWDRRNTGAFSSGEQATGNPYAPTAIETCCTVAWIALTGDYLRLTGDPRAADDLEIATLNGGLGAQHPSGRWWTYNTPMDGVREASAHTIVFQARAGTPELNCCSVNGPRVLGMLSDWAVMSTAGGVAVNSYLPETISLPHEGQQIRLMLDHDYPRIDSQRVLVVTPGEKEWTLRLRIPGWSRNTQISANFEGVPSHAEAGSFVEIRRRWKICDEVVLRFDFKLRAVAGANEMAGKVSLYRGPLLLAYDQAYNAFDEDQIPALNLASLDSATLLPTASNSPSASHRTWLTVQVPSAADRKLTLVDFASAGATGSRYRSWLPVTDSPPPPAFTQYPRDAERVRPGTVHFQWRRLRRSAGLTYRVEIGSDEGFAEGLLVSKEVTNNRLTMDLARFASLTGKELWWRTVAIDHHRETVPDVPPAYFLLAPDAPEQNVPRETQPGPKGELILHSLRAEDPPKFGEIVSAKSKARSPEGTSVNGLDQMLVYSIPAWPEEDFTVALRCRVDEMPRGGIGQVFSGWSCGMDDPLRLVVDHGKLFARIESGSAFSTLGVAVETGRWHHVAAVKRGGSLTLFVDGHRMGSGPAPEFLSTSARDCALGGNPHFAGNEFLGATFADFGFWARGLSEEELREIASEVH